MMVRKKTKKVLRDLKKSLCKLYGKNDQMLYITSWEWKKNKHHFLDIIAIDKENEKNYQYLFEIMTLRAFETFEPRYSFYMKDTGFYEYFDVESASITPFYFDRTFTLKKFTPITEEDVIRCCRYFIEKVLKEDWIWNIKFVKPDKVWKK